MTARALLIGVALAAIALAALTLAFAARMIAIRRRAGLRWFWGGLVMRVIVLVALLWSGVATVQHLPAPPFVNHAAPVADAAVVVIHTQDEREGGDVLTGMLEGVSVRDGAVRWRRSFPEVLSGVVVGPPGMVFALGSGGARTLFAVRTVDGALLWSAGGAAQLVYGYLPRPLVLSDSARVYTVAAQPGGLAVTALSLTSGAPLWHAPISPAPNALTGMALDSGALYTAGENQASGWTVTARRASDGARLWSVTAPQSNDPRVDDRQPLLAAAAGLVFVAPRQDVVTALDARTGAAVWRAKASGKANDPLTPLGALAGGPSDTLYIAGQLLNALPDGGGQGPVPPTASYERLVALDLRTGAARWEAPLDVFPGALDVSDGLVLADGGAAALETFNAATGARVWNSAHGLTNDAPWRMTSRQFAPLTVGGAAFVMNNELDPSAGFCIANCPGLAWLYAANPRDGTLWWRARMGPVSLTHWVL